MKRFPPQASQTSMYCFQGRLTGSMEIFFRPSRYSRVNDRGQAASMAEASAPDTPGSLLHKIGPAGRYLSFQAGPVVLINGHRLTAVHYL